MDNANRDLWPGTYVSVHFTFPSDPNILILPEQALLFRAQGMQVAVVDDQNRVHLQDVVLGHNLDTDVQIVSGLKLTDKIVASPSLGLLEGQQVKIVQPVPGYQPGRGTTPVPPLPEPPSGPIIPGASPARAAQPTAAMEPSEPAHRRPPARIRCAAQGGADAGRRTCAVMGVDFRTAPRKACSSAVPSLRRSWRPSSAFAPATSPRRIEPPHYVLPADYQGSGPFKLAHPLDTLPRGPWWERFGDPLLDQLERQLTAENPDLAALAEQYTQARDLAAEARSGLFPQLTASGLLSDNKESQYQAVPQPAQHHSRLEEASNVIQATASWEPDFWSQIRNSTRAQKRLAQASAATLAAARLSLQAELANDYIALRGLDSAGGDLSRIDRLLREGGPDHDATACRAASRRPSTWRAPRVSWPRRRRCRAALLATVPFSQHAIAVLVGANPSSFSIPEDGAVAAGPAGRAGGRAVQPAAAPAGHRQRRAADGGGERRDRRFARRLLPQHHPQRGCRVPG